MTTDSASTEHVDKKRKMSPAPSSATTTENTDVKSDIAPTSNLLIKRLSEKAKLPTRGSALAAGYDLYRYVTRLFLPSTHVLCVL